MTLESLDKLCRLVDYYSARDFSQVLADDVVATRAEVAASITAPIDIKPGSNPNSIDLPCQGYIPVALITTPDFNAAAADPPTMAFAGASPAHWAMEDVDSDGDLDLVLHFNCRELNIARDATVLCLQGVTPGGISIEGCDSVRIVPEHEPGRGDAPTTTPAVAGPGAASPRGSGPRALDGLAAGPGGAATTALDGNGVGDLGAPALLPADVDMTSGSPAAAGPANPAPDSGEGPLPPPETEPDEWAYSWPWLLLAVAGGLPLMLTVGLGWFLRPRHR